MMKHQRDDVRLDSEEGQPARRREPDRSIEELLDFASLSEGRNALMEFPAEPSYTAWRSGVRLRERLSARLPVPSNKRELMLILGGATIGLVAVAVWRLSLQPVTTVLEPPAPPRAVESSTPVAPTIRLPPSSVRPDAPVSPPAAADTASSSRHVDPSLVRSGTSDAQPAVTAAASPATATRSVEPLPRRSAPLPPTSIEVLRTTSIAPSSLLAEAAVPAPPVVRARSPSAASPLPERDVGAARAGSADLSNIERVVRAYQESYNRLDARSTALVWPTVDTGALARAFSTLVEQQLSFDRCEFDVEGGRATASCAGAVRYVQRIGDPTPQVQQMSWAFQLQRTDRGWQIEDVMAR